MSISNIDVVYRVKRKKQQNFDNKGYRHPPISFQRLQEVVSSTLGTTGFANPATGDKKRARAAGTNKFDGFSRRDGIDPTDLD